MKRFNLNSITTRLVLLGLAILFAGAVGRIYFLSNFLRKDITALASGQMQSLADYAAKDIHHGLTDRRAFLAAVAAKLPLTLLDKPRQLQAWLGERYDLNPAFTQGLVVVDTAGRVLAGYPARAQLQSLSVADRDYFLQAMRGEFATGCPEKGRTSLAPELPMAAPLRDSAGHVQAVLVGASLLQSADFLGAVLATRVGNTGGLVLVSPHCRMFVAASDANIALQPTPPEGRDAHHDRAMQGFRGVGIDVREGVEELAAVVSVPHSDWFVVARMPTQELFEPVTRLRAFIRNNSLLLALIFGVILAFLLRRQLRPLRRAARHADRMASGELPMEPLPVVANDEVGQLTTAFNRVMDKLLASHAEMDHMAHHDSLTGLPNRQMLADRMHQAFARAQRHGDQVAVLFMDLDGFKPINDDLGHEAGDTALCEVAKRLSAVVRGDDTVARVGGDEFVILLPDLRDSARATAELVAHKCQEVFQTPFDIHGQPCHLGLSMGIAMGSGDGTPDKLLIAADKAMYRAKDAGRGQFMWAKV